jgi:hypothetical protein
MMQIMESAQVMLTLSIVSLTSHHSSYSTCSVVGTDFDPMGTCTSLVTVVPSSKIATVSSRVQLFRLGIHIVQTYQYKTPNKRLYIELTRSFGNFQDKLTWKSPQRRN